jgi:hypothetical protein
LVSAGGVVAGALLLSVEVEDESVEVVDFL